MIYGVHYRIIAKGKSEKTFTCNIWEKLYVDEVLDIQASNRPFVLNVLANNDDPFAPSLSSELVVTIDITDFAYTLPDITTRDDRKYFVTFLSDTDLVFQGYLLIDSLKLNFSTGRKILQVSCVDGVGMLQQIPYLQNYAVDYSTPQNGAVMVDINTTETLLNVVFNCLDLLEMPSYKLNIGCNIYATDMDETITAFEQINYFLRNWQNTDLTWMDCKSILETIATNFGCKFFQANGEYWIANIAEMATGSLRYFKFDSTRTLINSGTVTTLRTVNPYSSTEDYYFVDNTQTKIVRKGYPVIENKSTFEYAPNLIDNGNFKRPTTFINYACYNWLKQYPLPGTSTITTSTINDILFINMFLSGATSLYLEPQSVATVASNDSLKLSFLLGGQSPISTTVAVLRLLIQVAEPNGSGYYYLDNANGSTTPIGATKWTYSTSPSTSTLYYYVMGGTTAPYETVTIDMPLTPISGLLNMRFILSSSATSNNAQIGNVILTSNSLNDYLDVKGYYDNKSQYKKEIKLGFSYDVQNNNTLKGVMCRTNTSWPLYQLIWLNWYRYGSATTEQNLPRLLIQDYVNVQSGPQINIDASIFNGQNGISLLNTLKFTDTTYIYSIDNLPFIFGNASFDFIDATISGTWLQISSTEVTETISNILIKKLVQ